MPEPAFKYLDRESNKTIVLIPGWAADHRIFNSLNLNFNYLLAIDFSPFPLKEKLLNTLEENGIEKVSLLGWSLGGFLAADFAGKHPNLVEELILVSIREKYKQEEIAEVKKLLKKSKKGYLYKFYSQCFFKREKLNWFKKNLFRAYCQDFGLEYLLATLDYLGSSQINTNKLSEVSKIKIVHGDHDRIAPIDEAREVKERINGSEFIIVKDSGHIPFLEDDLGRYIYVR